MRELLGMIACHVRMTAFKFPDLEVRVKTIRRVLLLGLIISLLVQTAAPVIPFAYAAADNTKLKGDLRVEQVTVEGNRLVPTEDILGVVKTHKGDKFDRKQVLEDLKAINNMGYFDDRNLQVVPELTNGGVLLKIRVQENAPVTGFGFQGNDVISTEEISQVFADQLGKPQNLSRLSGAIDKIEKAYHERGFVLARVVDVQDDPDGSIHLKINEGVVDEIKIEGNKKTKDFIIKHALKMKPGTVYNERELTANLRKLFSNGYFNDIRRSLAPSSSDPEKYQLKVEVDERRTGSIGLGGGVDTIAGPFGSFSFSDSNFKGRGHVVSFNSQLGSGVFGSLNNNINNGGQGFLSNRKTYRLEASWINPHLKGSNTSMAVSGFARDFNSFLVDEAQQRTLGAKVNFGRKIKGNWQANLGLAGESTSLFEAFDNGNLLNNLTDRALAMGAATTEQGAAQLAQSIRDQQLKGGTYFTVNPSVHYDTRDSRIDPSKGTHARLTASPSAGITGTSFAKMGGSVSKFIPVGKWGTLAFNAQGGSSLGGLPQFAQYRLGGFNGIRGYRYFSDLGTGSSMMMATAEMRFKLPFPGAGRGGTRIGNTLQKHVKGVAFFDVGTVSGNSLINNFYQRSATGASVGVGLRLKVPMLGLIRLDYGLPLVSSILGRMTPRVTVGFGEKF